MAEGRRGGKKHRKHGRQKNSQAFKRYWEKQVGTVGDVREWYPNRHELHRARRVYRVEQMVLESQERKRLQREAAAHDTPGLPESR